MTKPVTDTSPAPDWVVVGSSISGTGLVIPTLGLGYFDETMSKIAVIVHENGATH